jgi:hypothetical protein
MFDMRYRHLCVGCGEELRAGHCCNELLHLSEREEDDRLSLKIAWRMAYRQSRWQQFMSRRGASRFISRIAAANSPDFQFGEGERQWAVVR